MEKQEFESAEQAIQVLEKSLLKEHRALAYILRWRFEEDYDLNTPLISQDEQEPPEPREEDDYSGSLVLLGTVSFFVIGILIWAFMVWSQKGH